MEEHQQIIYEIHNKGFEKNYRSSNDQSILLAKRRDVRMSYTRCNEILWDKKEKVVGRVKNVYHRLVVQQPNYRISTSLPTKTDKLKDSQTTIITTNNKPEFKWDGSESLRSIKKLSRNEIISQYENYDQQNQRIIQKRSMIETSFKKQDSIYNQSDCYQNENRDRNQQKEQNFNLEKNIKNYTNLEELLSRKKIRQIEQFDLPDGQIGHVVTNNQKIRKKHHENYDMSFSNNSYTIYQAETQLDSPHFKTQRKYRVNYTQNTNVNSPTQLKEQQIMKKREREKSNTKNQSIKNLWKSQIIRKIDSPNIKFQTNNAQSSQKYDDKQSMISKKSNHHLVIKSTCNIQKINKDQNNENPNNKMIFLTNNEHIDQNQSSAIKFSNENPQESFNLVKMNREQYQWYKRKKQEEEQKLKDSGLNQEQYHIKPYWAYKQPTNLFKQKKQNCFISSPKSSIQYQQNTIQTNMKDNIKQVNVNQHSLYSSNSKIHHKGSHSQLVQPLSSRPSQIQDKNFEKMEFYRVQLKSALTREKQLINLYMEEEKRSEQMGEKIKQLEQMLSNSAKFYPQSSVSKEILNQPTQYNRLQRHFIHK